QDINVGGEWSVWLGVSPTILGDDHTHLFTEARYERWIHTSLESYLRVSARTSGRVLAGIGSDLITSLDVAHYYQGLRSQTLVTHFSGSWGHNLDGDTRFTLGGESGLRGYDARRFDGNKLLLLNLEDRIYWVNDWLHLVSIGFAGFADAGYVWRAGRSVDLGDLAADIGLGLRFDVTRGSSGTIFRIDYAYPLNQVGQEENSRGILSFATGLAF
ncbi:MAG TPA: BamA/TamA family outer membrane protein, partial [Candidatus Polarisedimenticolia bacterium]|nr:BamA/TamA family outer membrane protein [Candidatus Polarisedimenticolia bacterium]